MNRLKQCRVIIVGAGIGGLAAAKALSRFFGQVTIIDRDTLPENAAPRTGAPQSRQVHVLLGGGLRALNALAPEFEERLVAAGARRATVGSEIQVEFPGLPVLPVRPFDFHTMCMSRPLLEFVLRRIVTETPNIEIIDRCRVSAFVPSDDGERVVAVQGQLKSGESLVFEADFFVDAASRSDITLRLLDELGLPRPKDTQIGIDLNYSTATFEIPAEATGPWKAVIHRPTPSNGRAGFLFPIENGQWHVNLNSVHGDGAGSTEEEFLEFARSLRTQTIYDALRSGRMIGPVRKFILNSSSRRHYEDLTRFPGRLIVIGDAICRYNPAYGQGMSVAAQEAEALMRLLESRLALEQPLASIAAPYFDRMASILAAPWSVAEADFVYPQTRGERTPDVENRIRINRNLVQLAFADPAMHRLWAEVTNLLRPASVLQDAPYAEILAEDPPPLPPEAMVVHRASVAPRQST